MNSTRQALINSMKELLWLRGYDATSPNQVLDHCGAGKGSFYHHFRGKKALAIEAMNIRVDEMIDEFDAIFNADIPWLQKFESFLLQPRAALKGCPVGRMTADPSMVDKELRAPLSRYFNYLLEKTAAELKTAQQQGTLNQQIDAQAMATMVVSTVQGGYVVSRAMHADNMANSCQGAYQALRQLAGQDMQNLTAHNSVASKASSLEAEPA